MPNPFKQGTKLTKRASAAATPVPRASEGPVGLKEINEYGDGVGEITHISLGSEYGGSSEREKNRGRVRIRFGPEPKPRKGKDPHIPYEDRPLEESFNVPLAMAKKLTLGQKVRVSIDPVE